jgi:hypothetical protein
MGETEGIIELTGKDAADSITFDNPHSPCTLHFHFERGKITVDVGGVESCGWGYGVNAEGTYHKLANQKPDFDESNGYYSGTTYRAIIPKIFFYEDSLLTKPQKSYLVKGDTLHDLTSSLHAPPTKAIYTEIYNKKHLTLTYGWIPKADLKKTEDR